MKLSVYLAGSSKEIEYRTIVLKDYSCSLNIINPMNIVHEQVLYNIGKNEFSTYIVNRDKRLILSSDILVAYIGNNGSTFGTSMEIIYAYENGIPVYIIDSTKDMIHSKDIWVNYHAKKIFSKIDECFYYILSIQ